jgi:hypothetical protein
MSTKKMLWQTAKQQQMENALLLLLAALFPLLTRMTTMNNKNK